ncbi:serine-enriched protein-like [Gigantopelta aegis]|uniref:serine-enriched protein-like n=1 Tax=Gigantopelta aegis TaxID=1735272 RepID=UPI001B8888DF|nr:serine-enriched protein-like [Gigantopelta aegis]
MYEFSPVTPSRRHSRVRRSKLTDSQRGFILQLAAHEYSDKYDSSSGYDSDDSRSSVGDDQVSATCRPPSVPGEIMLFSNTSGLCDSLKYIITMPELCDVMFLVGKERDPVYGVKAILATRSRVLYQLILFHQRKMTDEASKKKSKSRRQTLESHLTIPVPDYDIDVFRSLVMFLHCGKVKVDAKIVVGLLCAASEYELKDLSRACWDFVRRMKGQGQKDNLMTSATRYGTKKAAQKLIMEKMKCFKQTTSSVAFD